MASAFFASHYQDEDNEDDENGHRRVTIARSRQLKSFVRKTKRGIHKTVREHYLRNDIDAGFSLVENGSEERGNKYHCILPDTNVLLHFLDFLESDVCHTFHCMSRHVMSFSALLSMLLLCIMIQQLSYSLTPIH